MQRNIFLQSYSAVLSTYLFGLEDDEPAFALGFDSAELMVEEDNGNNLLNVWIVFCGTFFNTEKANNCWWC